MSGKGRLRRQSQAATGSSWSRAEAVVVTPSTKVMGTSRCSCMAHLCSGTGMSAMDGAEPLHRPHLYRLILLSAMLVVGRSSMYGNSAIALT